MNSLVELISKMGIFMIASQAVIHFAPAQKYEKYIKLIVSIVILLQFLSPIYKLVNGTEMDWGTQFSNLKTELDEGEFIYGTIEGNPLNESIIAGMEKEIKTKLNNEISGEGYSVIKVDVEINVSNEANLTADTINNNSYEKYELAKVRVAVRVYGDFESYENKSTIDSSRDNADKDSKDNTDKDSNNSDDGNVIKVDKVSVPKIGSGEDTERADKSDQKSSYDKKKISNVLRERFCNVLGIEEKYIEVSIYGTVE